MVGGVGPRQLRRGQREHPRHVDGDVPGADHHRLLGLQIDLQAGVVRVAVVPGHELGGRVRSAQVLAWNPEPFVDRGAERVDDRVVVLKQPATAHVGPELDVTEEPKPLVLGGLVVRLRDRLDLRMVRSHARAHEPIRRRQAVVEVDGELRLTYSQQLPGGVEPTRAGPDDRDADREVVGHFDKASALTSRRPGLRALPDRLRPWRGARRASADPRAPFGTSPDAGRH